MAQPWDDSALITAFNSAIAKYKTMHAIGEKGKATNATEDSVHMESGSHAVAISNEHEMEYSELSQKEENGGVPPLQADKLSSHEEGRTGKNITEEVPAGYNGHADQQSYAQHHGHSATAENCYLCQWNAYYYQQPGAWTSPGASGLNGLQCQYCGYINQPEDATKNHHQTPHVSQAHIDSSAFPDIVRTAVAEALKTTDGEKSTGVTMESSQVHSSFSDVAVAWFLAGFHTSRYLSQSK